MKTVLSALGVFALASSISSTDTNEMDSEMPLELMDLPAELRIIIFEYLDGQSLLNIRKLFPQDRNLIERVFRKMFAHHELRIYFYGDWSTIETTYDHRKSIHSDSLNETETDVEEMSEFLKYFGHCINRFVYLTYVDAAHEDKNLLELILRPIRKYVTKYVNEFYFYCNHCTENPLDRLDFAFLNVKSVQGKSSRVDGTTLHQIFPAVRSLDLEIIRMSSSLPHLPNLERLIVPDNWMLQESDLPLFNQTLMLNPQLKHLTISKCNDWNVIEMLNKIRPDIESLYICGAGNIDSTTVPTRFEKTKVFLWEQYHNENDRLPLEFGSLEEIDFNGINLIDYWINVLMQNKKLKKVTAHHPLHRENLQQIADGLPNLEEFTMKYGTTDPRSVQDIVDFMRRAKQVKRAAFWYLGRNECNEAAEQLKNEWKNTENDSACRFIRLNGNCFQKFNIC